MRCKSCPLKNAKQVESDYQGLSPEKIEVAFVGEAPGSVELQTGKPFTGPSGDVMRGTANGMGCPPYALLNTTQCLPNEYMEDTCRDACKPRLFKELKNLSPKLTVALGASAVKALVPGQKGIMNIRRRFFTTEVGLVMACLHPAYYLHQDYTNDEISDFFDSIKLATNTANGTYPLTTSNPHYVIPTSAEELKTHLAIVEGERVAIDLETTGFDPIDDEILCVIIGAPSLTIVIPWALYQGDEDVQQLTKSFLEACQHVTYVGNFDLAFFRHRGIDIHLQRDLFITHYTNDETMTNSSLKARAVIELGVEDWEGEVKRYAPKKTDTYANVPTDTLHKYGALDGHYTKALEGVMWPEVTDASKHLMEHIMIPASDLFIDIQLKGIPVSVPKIFEAAEKLDARLADLRKSLQDYTKVAIFNPNAPHEVKRQLYGEMDFPNINNGSTDRPTLETLQERCSDNPHIVFVNTMLEYRDLMKTRGTYISELARFTKRDSRLHPQFNICGTVTGRPTCIRPNLLNVKEVDIVKRIYVAPKGWIYGSADQSQSELRCYAGLAEDQGLTDFFVKRAEQIARGEKPLDIHDYAWELTKCQSRVIAKTFVFGPLYGRTAEAIAYALNIPVPEAIRIREEIMKLFPMQEEYAQSQMKAVFETQTVVNPFGRVRHFPYLAQDDLNHIRNVAVNSPIQSTSNDLNLLSLITLCDLAKKGEIVFWPLQNIYDSINFLAPEKEWDNTHAAVTEVMESKAREEIGGWFNKVPFEVKIGQGYDWEEADPSPMEDARRTSTRQLDQLARR